MQPSEVCPVTEPPSDPVACPPENTKTEMPVDIIMSLLGAVFDHEPGAHPQINEVGSQRVAKAAVPPVTKCLQCVKVHESNVPQFASFGYITPPRQSLTRIAEINLV